MFLDFPIERAPYSVAYQGSEIEISWRPKGVPTQWAKIGLVGAREAQTGPRGYACYPPLIDKSAYREAGRRGDVTPPPWDEFLAHP